MTHLTHTHCGYTIEIEQDTDACNPFTDFNGEPPLVADMTDYSNGDALKPLDGASDRWIARNWTAIAKALDIAPQEALQAARAYDSPVADIRRDAITDALDAMGKRDMLSAIAALWTLRGYAALDTCVTGYSQGDYTDLLIVATPQWIKLTGAPKASHMAQLESARSLYAAWAFGDVYGYTVTAPNGDMIDSCYGFYGDPDTSGLVDHARDVINSDIAARHKTRLATLATLIRNRVPLDKRAALLNV